MSSLPSPPVRMQLFLGPTIPVPAPKFVVDALQEVKVETSSGDAQSGFELTFEIPKNSPIQAVFPINIPVLRTIVAVTVRGVTEVLIDGVITHQDLTANGQTATLRVKGKDLSAVMDLIPLDGLPYPAMPPSLRVLTALAKYAALGCVPLVIPTPLMDIPIPVDRIPAHRGTDYAYIKLMAEQSGYVFYVDPGPTPGASKAYWGPEIRVGMPQPALSLGLDRAHDNVTTLSFTFDKERKELPLVYIQEPVTKAPLVIPIPDGTPFTPLLGLVPPLPPKITKLNESGNLGPVAAIMQGIGYAAKHSDSVFGTGTLDVARYGHVLKPRRLVGVRGAGAAFDGLHFVTKVTHELKRGSYTQSFSLARNGVISTIPVVTV